MSLHLVPVALNDWEELFELQNVSASPYFAVCENEEGVKKYIQSSSVYFIQVDGEKIGTISFKKVEGEPNLINGLCIHPNERNKGYATTAMKEMLATHSAQDWALYVHPQNTYALIMYLQLGFKIRSWEDNIFGDGEPRLSLVLIHED